MTRRFAALLAVALLSGLAWPQGVITTLAGTDWVFPAGSRPAVEAPLGDVQDVTVDRSGALYIADAGNHLVVKITPDGISSIVAGNRIADYSGDGGQATAASLNHPSGVAVDDAGNVYIADSWNDRIRKVSPQGIITTAAGNGVTSFSGDGGPATQASLNGPAGVALDRAGNLYISESGNDRVRKISSSGIITTIAGTGVRAFSGDGGPAARAALEDLRGIAADAEGNVYVAANNRIRRISASGIINTVAGDGEYRFAGDGGRAASASLFDPRDVAVDGAGNLYIADTGNQRIRRVGGNGIITTVAGNGKNGFSGDRGPAPAASLNLPNGVALDTAGNFYIADTLNYRVRRVSVGGTIVTVGGNGAFRYGGDGGPAASAALNMPLGVAVDREGNSFIADTRNHRVRRVGRDGTISTVAGSGVRGFAGDGGPATSAWLSEPSGVAVDAAGNLYIADKGNDRVRRVVPGGIITTVAGDGDFIAADNVPATRSYVDAPVSVAVDAAGNLFIATRVTIRRVDRNGIISTVAGNGQYDYSGDGGPANAAALNGPAGVAVDSAGNFYIADQYNARIRRVSGGIITTVAGNGIAGFSGDGGRATAASLNEPGGVAVDAAGNLYIADTGNSRVRVVNPSGTIRTAAGGGEHDYPGDGEAATAASLRYPGAVAVDASGNLYIGDTDGHRLRFVLAAAAGSPGAPSFQVSPAVLNVSARAGGGPSIEHSLGVSGSLPGLPFGITASASWLRVNPARGSMPTTVKVSADPAGLSQGSHQATLTITSPNASPATSTVNVTLVVEPETAPRLGAHPDSLSFSFATASGATTHTLTVTNQGGGTLSFTAAGPEFVSVSPAAGSASARSPASLTVRVDAAQLVVGTYTGGISLVSSTTGETLTVPLTVTVSAVRQSIRLSQSGLAFTAVAGGGGGPPQSFAVLNAGQGAMSWSVSTSTLSGGTGWLSASPGSGSSDAQAAVAPQVEVRANPAGLAPGEYYGQVAVTSGSADNSPQLISVVLNVLRPGSNPGAVVRPAGLVFSGVAGGASPGSQDVLVYNLTATPTTYASSRVILDEGNWLAYVPATATVAPERPTRLVVQAQSTRLAAGVRRGALTLLFSDGSIRTVNILFVLGAAGSGPPGAVAQTSCRPARLLPLFTLLPDNFSTPVNWPTPLEVRVVDDCGNSMTRGSVVVTFSNGDPPLSLVSLGEGRWSATWQARTARPGQVTATVTAEAPDLRISGSAQVTGSLRENLNPPVVGSGAVVSAASFAAQAPLAPGSLISIFGARLSERPGLAARLPLETELGGALVSMAGRPLPLLYASEDQINAQVPYDISVNTRHQLLVRRRNSYAVPEPVTVAAAQPAVFTKDQSGRGQGVIVDTNFRYVESGNAVAPGDVIIIYGAGLGAVDPPVAAGTAAPASPLARTVNPVSVTIGGATAEVIFAGLAPGFAGLYQVNAIVPAGATAGDAAPVIVTVAGQSSRPVTMAVR